MKAALRRSAVVVGSFLLASLAVLLLLELGLRVIQWAALRSRDAPRQGRGGQTILCIGDSWTYGQESGDAGRRSYPATLQRLIDRRASAGRYRVVNRGYPGYGSQLLLRRVPELLEEHRPRIVVLLVGGLNWLGRDPGPGRGHGSGDGFLGRLKVVRLLRMLVKPSAFPPPPELDRQLGRVRDELTRLLASSEAVGSGNGQEIPPLPMDGCADPGRTAEELRAIAGHGSSAAQRLHQLTRREPSCSAVWVVLAESCVERRDYACARRAAQRALAQVKDEPRASTALAQALKGNRRRWPDRALEILEEARIRHPGYQKIWRLLIQVELDSDLNLCSVRSALERLIEHHPKTRWARSALAVVDESLARRPDNLIWAEHGKQLRDDLGAIVSLCRQSGASVLMLNYPYTRFNPCSPQTRRQIAQFARDEEIPLTDLQTVLRGDRALYAAGGHPSAAGYAKIAGVVLDRLLQLGWIE